MIKVRREPAKYGKCSSCDKEKIEFRVSVGIPSHMNVERLCTGCLTELKEKIGRFIY